MGRSYVIEHCIYYYKRKTQELQYRVNVTEVLRGILGVMTGQWDDIPRYADIVLPQKNTEKELTAEEVVNNIKRKLGG